MWDYIPHDTYRLQVTWRLIRRWIRSERRRSHGHESTRSSNRDVSGRKAAANEKKRRNFLPPNKAKRLFFRAAVETTWTNEKKEVLFTRLIRQKSIAEIPCGALNALQFKPIEISDSRIKCTALNETACIKCNAVSTFYVAALDSLKANLMM